MDELEKMLERKRLENKYSKEATDIIAEILEPILDVNDTGRCVKLYHKLTRKIADISDPKVLFGNEEKAKKTRVFLEQLSALIDQFIKDEEKKDNE